jgi:hypothetical protein
MMKKVVLLICIFSSIIIVSYSQTTTSSGTGFFVSNNGIIITCAHIIEASDSIVVFVDTKEYLAEILSIDPILDLAALKIDYKNPLHLKIGGITEKNLGDRIYVFGFPLSDILGSTIRVTDGIISAIDLTPQNKQYFQFSAPIQPGNSGGPIVNEKYEVIGIATAKLNELSTLLSTGSLPQNVNFGVKSIWAHVVDKDESFFLENITTNNSIAKSINDVAQATVYIECKFSNKLIPEKLDISKYGDVLAISFQDILSEYRKNLIRAANMYNSKKILINNAKIFTIGESSELYYEGYYLKTKKVPYIYVNVYSNFLQDNFAIFKLQFDPDEKSNLIKYSEDDFISFIATIDTNKIDSENLDCKKPSYWLIDPIIIRSNK